jgi:VanZ family protein
LIYFIVIRATFFATLCLTLLALLSPGHWVTDFNNWAATWLPFSRQLDAMDASHHADKLVHSTLFAVMGYLAVRGWTQRRHLVWVLLGVLWLAPQTEWLQAYIPGRGASLVDALADVLGLAVGVVWALLLRRRHQRRSATVGGASVATAAVTPTVTSG